MHPPDISSMDASEDTTQIVPSDTKPCSFCGESILVAAKKCKHCGEFLDEQLRKSRAQEATLSPAPSWTPGIAAICSFFIPGLGQIYKGQVLNGLCWLVLVLLGYVFFIVPGLILHALCLLGAASGGPSPNAAPKSQWTRSLGPGELLIVVAVLAFLVLIYSLSIAITGP